MLCYNKNNQTRAKTKSESPWPCMTECTSNNACKADYRMKGWTVPLRGHPDGVWIVLIGDNKSLRGLSSKTTPQN